MKKTIAVLGVLLAAGLVAPLASAQVRSLPQKGAFSVMPEVSLEFSDTGAVVDDASVTYTAAGTFAGRAVSAAATISTQAREFKDVYQKAQAFGMNFNYGLSEKTELFGRARLTNASAKEFNGANVSAAIALGGVALTANATLQAKLADYKSVDLDIGVRHFFSNATDFKPYFAPSIGIAKVSAIDLKTLSFGGTDLLSGPKKFYDASSVLRYGFGIGFRYDIAKDMALGLETGIQYQEKLSANSSDLGTYKANNSGKRSYIPLTVGLQIVF